MFVYKIVQVSEPFKNRPKSTIQKQDMSGFRIPTVTERFNHFLESNPHISAT